MCTQFTHIQHRKTKVKELGQKQSISKITMHRLSHVHGNLLNLWHANKQKTKKQHLNINLKVSGKMYNETQTTNVLLHRQAVNLAIQTGLSSVSTITCSAFTYIYNMLCPKKIPEMNFLPKPASLKTYLSHGHRFFHVSQCNNVNNK